MYDATPSDAGVYPWKDFAKGIISIGAVILVYSLNKVGEDSLTFTLRHLIEGTGLLLDASFKACKSLAYHVRRFYWMPTLLLLATWYLFPDIVDDFLFLIYLSYTRYTNIFL